MRWQIKNPSKYVVFHCLILFYEKEVCLKCAYKTNAGSCFLMVHTNYITNYTSSVSLVFIFWF